MTAKQKAELTLAEAQKVITGMITNLSDLLTLRKARLDASKSYHKLKKQLKDDLNNDSTLSAKIIKVVGADSDIGKLVTELTTVKVPKTIAQKFANTTVTDLKKVIAEREAELKQMKELLKAKSA